MRHIVMSSVAYPTLQYLSTLSHSQHNFLLNTKYLLNFSPTSVRHSLILSTVQPDTISNTARLHVKCRWQCWADVNGSWMLRDKFSKNTQIPNFQCWPPDRQSDVTKLTVAVRRFTNPPTPTAVCITLHDNEEAPRTPHYSILCHLTWQWRAPSLPPRTPHYSIMYHLTWQWRAPPNPALQHYVPPYMTMKIPFMYSCMSSTRFSAQIPTPSKAPWM